MKNIVLKYGLVGGVVCTALMWATLPFIDTIGFENGVYVGYTGILISMLSVYFGMRAYRDTVLGGSMSFAKGFNAGLLITLITCLFYVASWLTMYYFVIPDFGVKYGAYLVESAQARGASPAEIEAMVAQSAQVRDMLDNPAINAAVSFTEPFPVGLLVTLISAAILRKQEAA